MGRISISGTLMMAGRDSYEQMSLSRYACDCVSLCFYHLNGRHTHKTLAFLVVGWNAASFMELPWVLTRSATHLFKQAICTAYAGHKPLTVSGKVNVCTACLWISCSLFVCSFIVFCSLCIWVYFICVYVACVMITGLLYQSRSCVPMCPCPESGHATHWNGTQIACNVDSWSICMSLIQFLYVHDVYCMSCAVHVILHSIPLFV